MIGSRVEARVRFRSGLRKERLSWPTDLLFPYRGIARKVANSQSI